jgi:hypothetical protein
MSVNVVELQKDVKAGLTRVQGTQACKLRATLIPARADND